jgi:glycosyltransferase involved in cell wall biosynthesis
MNGHKIQVLVVGHAYVLSGEFQKKLDALAETGSIEVGLVAPKEWKSDQWGRTFRLEHQSKEAKFYEVPTVLNGIQGAYLMEPLSLLRVIRDFQPDIIQVEQEVFSLVSFELAALQVIHRRPLIFFGWENIDRPRRLGWLRKITRTVVLKSASAITCGNSDNQSLIRKWGYAGPTWVMPEFGVDVQTFSAGLRSEGNREFTFAFVGALTHQKGIDILLDALRELKQRGLGFKLVVCGVGPCEADLRLKAIQCGLADQVIWRGLVPPSRIATELAVADALVLPSRTLPELKEQFGLVPVVGSNSGGIPDVIGREDLLFPEGDVAALAHILECLMKNEDWRRSVSEYGIARVQQHYTHECIARDLLCVYKEVLAIRNLPCAGTSIEREDPTLRSSVRSGTVAPVLDSDHVSAIATKTPGGSHGTA